jgi:WXG100 family type VII secretion target
MGNGTIQIDYGQMAEVAKRFAQQAEASSQVAQHILQQLHTLENGGWVGEGAKAFFSELNDMMLPALQRLAHGLEAGEHASQQIAAQFREAEEATRQPTQRGLGGSGDRKVAGLDALTPLAHIQSKPHEPHKLSEPAIKAINRLVSLPRRRRISYVRRLREKHPNTYRAIVKATREGYEFTEEVVAPIAIDMAFASPWGQTGEGRMAMAHLTQMYAEGKVQLGNSGVGHGVTVPADENNTWNGQGSPSTVTLSEKLSNTPEGLAAIAAHEALHSYRMSKGSEKHILLDSETDANTVLAKVWASFGKGKYLSYNSAIWEFDETSKQFDPANSGDDSRMRTHTATEYAYGYASTGNPHDIEQGAGMINALLSRSDATQVIDGASDEQLKRMMYAYNAFLEHFPERHSSVIARNWRLLFDEMDSRKQWTK